MKFRFRFADQIVGIFVLAAIAGLAAILILIGANQRWFAKNYMFWSKFSSANGLNVGLPIKLRGFEIGQVKSISLSADNTVNIEFYVYDTYYEKITANSVLEISSNPLGLGGGLLFHIGKAGGDPLPEFSYIPSLDTEEGRALVRQGLVDLPKGEDVINSLLAKADESLFSLNQLIVSVNDAVNGVGTGPLGEILIDLAVTTDELNALLREMQAVASHVEKTSAALEDPTGLVKTLLDPRGSVATLLDDDNRLYEQLAATLEELGAIVSELVEFSVYLNSSQPQITGLLEKGRITLDQSNAVLEALKNNPLLRGGIPEEALQPTTFRSYRDGDF
jgi:phospholipid/cholesterol/gamma-HCH transport system substrate-binding protein